MDPKPRAVPKQKAGGISQELEASDEVKSRIEKTKVGREKTESSLA
jgi:hypothetical protein